VRTVVARCRFAQIIRLHHYDVACCYQCFMVCVLVTTVSHTKVDEPTCVSFGTWTRVGPRNHVLGVLDPHSRRDISEGHFLACCKLYGIFNMWTIFSALFGRWQQQCSLSLSLFQQLVGILSSQLHRVLLAGMCVLMHVGQCGRMCWVCCFCSDTITNDTRSSRDYISAFTQQMTS